MAFNNSSDFINELIISNNDREITNFDVPQTFLIPSSIYLAVLESLTRMDVEILQHLGSFELTVGEHTFDMEIFVMRPLKNKLSCLLFGELVPKSQYTYFWGNKFTLFREVDRYYELEEFIAINDLKKHVISVEEVFGVNSLGVPIKLVTFDGTRDKNQLFYDYVNFLDDNSLSLPKYKKLVHYYFTNALPWHRPRMLDIYRIPFRNQRIFQELQTFLTCMRELTYKRESHLDLISLCSLKLAFSDDLNVTDASRDLEFEIDALIERFLRRMQRNQTYIKNGNFDIKQYAIETNSLFNTSYPAAINLIYTFQHIFQCSNLPDRYFAREQRIPDVPELPQTLMLIDENKDLKILRDRTNISYDVNAKNYNKLNSKLFCELLKCRNVQAIWLDTNYKWINEPYFTNFGVYGSKSVTIRLVGTNEFNFIEDFVQFLKTVPLPLTSEMELIIEKVTLRNYNIFRNLKVNALAFCNFKITFTMLTELLECDVKNIKLKFLDCTIEDQTCTWSLLINGFDRENVEVRILEDEKTWQYLFESIANHLTVLKLNQFKFKGRLLMRCDDTSAIWICSIRFTLDEFNMRLDMRYDNYGKTIDLYHLKNFRTVIESIDDFEFYQ